MFSDPLIQRRVLMGAGEPGTFCVKRLTIVGQAAVAKLPKGELVSLFCSEHFS